MSQESVLAVGSTATNLTDMPTPSEMTIKLQDIDASTTTRSADGKIHRDRVCGGSDAKRKLEMKWAYPSMDDVKTILQAFKDVFFYVKYFDPYDGAMRTAVFYTGDRSVPMYNSNLHGNGVRWEELSFNIIEQ